MNEVKRETHGLKILENDIWAERIPHEEFKKLRESYPVAWFDEPDGNRASGLLPDTLTW